MKTFEVQSVRIAAPTGRVFDYIADPSNLPNWASAFRRVSGDTALLETPQGAVTIRLTTTAHPEAGTIDWGMTFPDGAAGEAFSRVMPDGEAASIYSFVLMSPPVPLEALEGALEAQQQTLATELTRLKMVLEAR
jgi:hypothetical protein